ncbi:hypothetical protein EB077_11045, partial [bacterium]|nr:hypothetical protein [bacterium]
METLTFREVVKMAREHDLILLIKSEGYALCDEQLKTLVTTNSLRRMAWYINNCEILGIVK